MLAFRVASPSLLVDLRKLAELRQIKIADDGVRARRHGALARHPRRRAAAHGASAAWRGRRACRALSDPQPRHRRRQPRACRSRRRDAGHRRHLRGEDRGRRQSRRARHRGGGFLQGPADDGAQPDEIITEIRLPAWPAERRWGFQEFARRRGDFALAAAMLFYDEDSGKAHNAHVGAIGVADRPLRLPAAEAGSTATDRRGGDREGRGRGIRVRSIRRTTFMPAAPIAGRWSASWSSARCKGARRRSEQNACRYDSKSTASRSRSRSSRA